MWALLDDTGIAFVTHIGGEGRPLPGEFHDNGREVSDFLGGGENIRAKDYLALPFMPAMFFGSLILDGLFDRFPRLRGAAIEQGATWVPSWMRQLDHAQQSVRRTEPVLDGLEHRPSDYVHQHLCFTPFPFEDVGWLIDECGDDLFMFSSDYPHPEGTRDPLGRFRANLTDRPTEVTERFYHGNFADLLQLT